MKEFTKGKYIRQKNRNTVEEILENTLSWVKGLKGKWSIRSDNVDRSVRMRIKDRPLDMTEGTHWWILNIKCLLLTILGFKRLKSLRQHVYFSLEKFGY